MLSIASFLAVAAPATRDLLLPALAHADECARVGAQPVMMGPNATWNATNRNTYDSIFFFHSRKAGGRSVRAYLNKVAKIHRVPYCEIEGVAYRPDDYLYDGYHEFNPLTTIKATGCPGKRPLRVSNLREPVARAWSSYIYEGRWPVKVKAEQRTIDTAVPFETWVTKTNLSRMEFLWLAKQNKSKVVLDKCASECYCMWFGASAGGDGKCAPSIAIRTLYVDFDLVLLAERLQDEGYMNEVSRLLGAYGPDGKLLRPSGDKRSTAQRFPSGFGSGTLPDGTSSTPDAKQHALLVALNKVDIRLYDLFNRTEWCPRLHTTSN